MVFKKGQSGNPAGAKKGQRARSPTLLSMKRVLAGKGRLDNELDADMTKWRKKSFPEFIKEFNRLLAIEEGRAETIAAPSGQVKDSGSERVQESIVRLLAEFESKPWEGGDV